jgi:hypothetical protein
MKTIPTQLPIPTKDYNRIKELTLTLNEIIGRFLHHISPKGFVLIRYYGFPGTRVRKNCPQFCRDQLWSAGEMAILETTNIEEIEPAGVKLTFKSPHCGDSRVHRQRELLGSGHERCIKTAA